MNSLLLQPDAALPGLESLLAPARLGELLAGNCGCGELSIRDIRYKPGTSCLVSYLLKLDNRSEFIHAKAFQRDDWPTRRAKFRESAILFDKLAVAVFRFPADVKLRSAKILMDNPAETLPRILFQDHDTNRFDGLSVLAYKPNRRLVVRVDRIDDQPFVVKIHDPSTFRQVLNSAAALKRIKAEGMPVRIGRSVSHNALAYEWIEGESLHPEQLCPDRAEEILPAIFEWLARLQQDVATRNYKLEVRGPAAGIHEIADFLGSICPPLSRRARETAAAIFSRDAHRFVPALSHGDFYDRQILLANGQVKVCDFDNCCVADSTLDLANFVAHLKLRAIRDPRNCALADAVESSCRRHVSQSAERANSERFDGNLAASLFRLATHPFRCGLPDWVDQCERILSSIGSITNRLQQHSNKPSRGADPAASNSSRSPAIESRDATRLAIVEDARFHFLAGIFADSHLTQRMRHQLPRLEKQVGQFGVHRVVARRHKPGRRCLLEFELVTDRGFKSILGKASAKRLDRDTMRLQRSLFDSHGFGYGGLDGICIAKPLGECPKWKMWLQDVFEGESGADLMRDGRLSNATKNIAAAISKLHHCGLQLDRRHALSDELKILETRLTAVCSELPASRDSVYLVLENCHDIVGLVNGNLNAPIHRDFYQDQILFDGNRTCLVDLVLLSIGHPALDVGNFCAHLIEDGLRNRLDPGFWANEEMEIIRWYLRSNAACSLADILALRAISFARHIAIAHSMPERRPFIEPIIAEALKLTGDFFEFFTEPLKPQTVTGD